MDHQPQHPIEILVLVILAVYRGLEWLGFFMLDAAWYLYQLTPDSWPAFARLLVFPVALYLIGFVWGALRD